MNIEDAVKLARNVEPLPPACTLNQMLVLALLLTGDDPCAGCNQDRGVCGGRPKRQGTP
jgi:hypothetical protein